MLQMSTHIDSESTAINKFITGRRQNEARLKNVYKYTRET